MARLNLYGNLYLLAGSKSLQLGHPRDATLRLLLALAAEEFPALEAELFDRDGALLPRVNVLLNGRNVLYLPGGLDAPVAADDTLDAFPPVAGG